MVDADARGVGCTSRRLWTAGVLSLANTGVHNRARGRYVEMKGYEDFIPIQIYSYLYG